MLVTQFEALEEPVRMKTMYWWSISINHWTVWSPAPLRLLTVAVSSEYINACFNSSRVRFITAVLVMKARMHAFLALMVVSIGAGLFSGMPLDKIAATMEKGMGEHARFHGDCCGVGGDVWQDFA